MNPRGSRSWGHHLWPDDLRPYHKNHQIVIGLPVQMPHESHCSILSTTANTACSAHSRAHIRQLVVCTTICASRNKICSDASICLVSTPLSSSFV